MHVHSPINLARKSFLPVVLMLVRPVQAQDDLLTRAEVEILLADRDAAIIRLQGTVRDLERRLAELEAAGDGSSEAIVNRQAPDTAAQPATVVPGIDEADDPSGLVVDPDAAERALERTLIQGGALLLPRGRVELAPSLAYGVSEVDYPEVIDVPGGVIAGVTSVERSSSNLNLEFRFGLPGATQLELGIPYVSVQRETTFSVDGQAISQSTIAGRGAGDLRIGLARTLMRESGWRPDLVGRVSYGTGSGSRTDNGIELGAGFEYAEASLSLVKRRDPLALLMSVGYTRVRPDGSVDPGDAARLAFGAAMAASPDSSVFGTLNYARFDRTLIDGQPVLGSDVKIASLSLGLSTILRRGRLLSVVTELGLNDESGDYSIGFSLPTRW